VSAPEDDGPDLTGVTDADMDAAYLGALAEATRRIAAGARARTRPVLTGGIVSADGDKTATWLGLVTLGHRQHVSPGFPEPGICVSRCPGKWPCQPHRMATALEKALDRHQPEQLYGLVEDYHGNVVCPHGADYDGDEHYEGPDGWHCKATPAVVVCSSCCDPDDDTLRSRWPCATWTDIAGELGAEA
jgi:hypothetical protein